MKKIPEEEKTYATVYLTVRLDCEFIDGFDPQYLLENLIYDFSTPEKCDVKVTDVTICDINYE